ncbi:hypothetical protein AJ79_05675 [Helicocarpus griseus UAMH5409]|uniref:Chitin-binding type-2 domain-containing protein n=1 Tax=Helicocarpus griseus UAMH5409 TaxID=1447875 RepID=A0A2B7XKZ9_9EURO|nr:hypothetical protein AJ79_05675 [Helicocarpus griseus UAMH5409]
MEFSLKVIVISVFLSICETVHLGFAFPVNLAEATDDQLAPRDCGNKVYCPTAHSDTWCIPWSEGFAMCERKHGHYSSRDKNHCKACVESNCGNTGCDRVMD